MSPPFIPTKGAERIKAIGVSCCLCSKGGCPAISGRGVKKGAMSSFPTCFFSFFHTWWFALVVPQLDNSCWNPGNMCGLFIRCPKENETRIKKLPRINGIGTFARVYVTNSRFWGNVFFWKRGVFRLHFDLRNFYRWDFGAKFHRLRQMVATLLLGRYNVWHFLASWISILSSSRKHGGCSLLAYR